MATVKLASATLPQLVILASTQLGLDVPSTIKEPALRAKIATAGFDKEEFEVDEADAGPAAGAATTTAATPSPDAPSEDDPRRLVEILIQVQEGIPGGKDVVPVGVNGSVMVIPRGKRVKVPAMFVRALNDAVKHVPEIDEDNRVVGFTEAPIYPVSIFGAA